MTPQTLATPGEYNAAPLGTVIIDGYTGSWQRAADAMTLDGLAMAEGQPSTVIHTPKPDPGNL